MADALALCAIPAPTFDEERRAQDVVARFGAPDGPATVIAAHLDTVFPGHTPLVPRRDDTHLHGPGIGDNCVGLAALLECARRLAEQAPAHPIVLAATVGEEGLGDLRGARALLDTAPCDAFVALEGHGRDQLQVAGVGSVRLRATITAPGGHSWGDRGAPSAVHALLRAGTAVLEAAGDAHVNVGTIEGGTSINTIAATAHAEIDLRDADDERLHATRERVEEALHAATPPGATLAIEPLGHRPAGATPHGHPLVEAARAARRAAGLPPAEEEASSTDANAALGRGIPAICVGLTNGTNAHRTDEHVEIAPLQRGLAALGHLVDALARGAR